MTYWFEVMKLFLSNLRWQDLLDIIVVSYILYRIFLLMKGTRAVQLIRGMLLLAVAYLISKALGLNTITWLVSSTATMIFVAIPIVFQPELRRALALLGQGELFRNDLNAQSEDPERIMEELITSVRQLSARRIGALMVIERQTGLNEFIETGTPIGGYITAELITTIFFPNSPLHDGAVILRGDRIAAAGSLLPLSESYRKSGKRHFGTRHRAAIGLTETTDAIALVVSEETGAISVAVRGTLQRHLTERDLREVLGTAYLPAKNTNMLGQWLSKKPLG